MGWSGAGGGHPAAGELVVAVCIDPVLEISTELRLPRGSTAGDLAELLAAQDPTGETSPQQVAFKLPAVGAALARAAPLDERHATLELCSAEGPEPLAPVEPKCGGTEAPLLDEPATAPAPEPEPAAVPPVFVVPEEPREPPPPRGAICAISDTHGEAKPNMAWLEELPAQPLDTLILAGDVGVELVNLEASLRAFTSKFKHVFYCFGNHECWLNRHKHKDSFEKLTAIRKLCCSLGVRTTAALVDGAWIVPIIGWYHSSWDTEPPLRLPPGAQFKREPRDAAKMSNDYLYCRWGDFENGSEELARRLDEENEAWGAWPLPEELLAEARLPPCERRHPIVSFSHFLPRMELYFEKRMSMEPNLAKLIGSDFIRSRVDQLRPDIHIFGHTHLCWDMRLDGTRYISWPLGMPEERHWRRAAFPRSDCSVPLQILDPEGKQAPSEEVCFGSRMYELIDRSPSSYVMGHRVASKFCPEAPVLFDDACMPGRRVSWALPENPVELERIRTAAKKQKELQRKPNPVYPQWRVVGGEDRGGILVREGYTLESPKYPERLSTGALVEEVSRRGEDRLMYRLLSGSGPETGWVLTSLPDKELMVPEPMPPQNGDMSLEKVLRLQDVLIKHLSRPEVQTGLESLLRAHQGKDRTRTPFARKRRAILQAEFDKVLPSFGFPRGNMMQLDASISDFYDVHTGNEQVKKNKRRIDELMFLLPR